MESTVYVKISFLQKKTPYGAQQMKAKQTVNVCTLLIWSFEHRKGVFYIYYTLNCFLSQSRILIVTDNCTDKTT